MERERERERESGSVGVLLLLECAAEGKEKISHKTTIGMEFRTLKSLFYRIPTPQFGNSTIQTPFFFYILIPPYIFSPQ